MPRPGKPKAKKPPKTEIHSLLARRIEEEMGKRTLNAHSLQRYGAVQRTIWDLLNAGSDPRLSTIIKVATALGLKPADLLREGAERRIVIPLHAPPPPMIPPPAAPLEKQDRKKTKR